MTMVLIYLKAGDCTANLPFSLADAKYGLIVCGTINYNCLAYYQDRDPRT